MHLSRRTFSASAAAGLAAWTRGGRLWAVPPRPKLIILVIAEQFRPEYLERAQAALVPGGFRRLLSQGAYFADCRVAASTFTASSLATLATGAWPQTHGIVAESWYDRAAHKIQRAAPELLEASTWADQVARAHHTRLWAIGMDPVNLALVAGRSAVTRFSMDANGQMVAQGQQPEWFADYRKSLSIDSLRNQGWLAIGSSPGAPPLRVLKYDAARPQEFVALYKTSPFALGTQFALARELIGQEKLGKGENLDVLCLVLGSTALLGYEVGSDSPLMLQMALALDRQLEATLEALDKAVGAENYDLIFTGAHGAPPVPDSRQRAKLAIPGEAVARQINRAVADRYDTSMPRNRYVERYVYPFLYLRADQLRHLDIDPREARQVAAQSALQFPGVTDYFTADGDCSQGGDWFQRLRNSFHATRSGDLMLSYAPEHVEEFGAGRGISYGSLYNYDCRVPLMLFGAQFRPRVFEYRVDAIDLAPTLARATGVSYPSSSTGRVLDEAFK